MGAVSKVRWLLSPATISPLIGTMEAMGVPSVRNPVT